MLEGVFLSLLLPPLHVISVNRRVVGKLMMKLGMLYRLSSSIKRIMAMMRPKSKSISDLSNNK